MQDGLTGFIVDNIDDAVTAVEKIASIERTACRNVFEKRFTSAHMAEQYIQVFQSMSSDLHLASRQDTPVTPDSQAIA
jgi:glycosyltransferase involved in cell wall biosynthesis